MKQIERWGVFEMEAAGRTDGNPFTDYEIKGCFRNEQETIEVEGFYDGEGIYRVRFMPSYEGIYTYRIEGSFSEEVLEGSIEVLPAGEKNHGPVRVTGKIHFAYADGTPYFSVGTTCYAWVNQEEERQEQTLDTLKDTPFNKIRFCIFPKNYLYNLKEPVTYPYERGNGEGLERALLNRDIQERINFPGMPPYEPDTNFNYQRFNVVHFRRFEKRIAQLRDLGIEADIILMHPYDRWGLNAMTRESCDLYIRYVVARFAAYRNVWWSLANEYDFIPTKQESDWERYAAIICEKDPYGHLRSIHNGVRYYDYTKSWITHCSMQRIDMYRHVEYTDEYLDTYGKPVVWDEIGYEGNIEMGWGNLPPQELVRRFWEAALRGGCAGHGETYVDDNDILWWSHGGILKGESAKRIQFLLDIYKETPGGYLKRGEGVFDEVVGIPINESRKGMFPPPCSYEIIYFGFGQPSFRTFYLPEGMEYEIDVIDTWDMTVTPTGRHRGETRIELPGKQYMAVRLRRTT